MSHSETIKAIELVDYVNNHIDYTFYVNEFPNAAEDNSAFIRMSGGMAPSKWTSLKKPSFQVVVRGGKDFAPQCEEVAYSIYEFFHNRTHFTLDTYTLGDSYSLGMGEELGEQKPKSIVHCSAEQSAPMYLGRDDNDRPLYSLNFTLTVI